MSKFDALDERIVEMLQQDGTLTNSELGRVLDVSEATIRRRRARLLDEGMMRIAAVPNPFKWGYRFIAIIGIHVAPNRLRNVEDTLTAMPEVRFLGVTLGSYDMILEAWFRSSDEFAEFVTGTLTQVEGMERSESFHVIRLSKYTYDWGKAPGGSLVPSATGRGLV